MMIRRIVALGILILGLGLIALRPASAAGDEVVVIKAEGIVLHTMTSFIERGIDDAVMQNASALVIQLDTPGGDISAMQDIVKLIRNAPIPVIVHVGPVGAQAGSAGAFITLAGHVSAMAPDTIIGASSPVDGAGGDIGETLYKKLVEAVSADMRNLTDDLPEEAQELAIAMITDARAVTADEAFDIGLIDVIARDVPDLLAQIDGLEVEVQGEPFTLETSDVAARELERTWLEQFQLLISLNTELIGILILAGSYAIYAELRAPGGYVLGGVGMLCLGVAFYALGLLPVNWFGVGLIAVAILMFFLETQTPTFGVLSLVGTIGLVFGLVVLFQTEEAPEMMRISLTSALGIAIPSGLMFFWLSIAMARVQRRNAITGKEGLIGAKGVVRKTFKPYGNRFRGTVLVKGELWTAEADSALSAESLIIIQTLDGFTAHVEVDPQHSLSAG